MDRDTRQLEAWARLAMDAEAFERSLEDGPRIADGSPTFRSVEMSRAASISALPWRRAAVIALAACTAFAVLWNSIPGSKLPLTRTLSPTPSPATPDKFAAFDHPLVKTPDRRTLANARPTPGGLGDDHAFVLAVYAPDASGDTCGEWRVGQFATGCPLREIDRTDLLRAALAMSGTCTPAGVQVIAVAAPGTGAGGTSTLQDKVAACLAGSPAFCEADSACYLNSAVNCLPAGLTVVSDSYGRRP